MPVDDRRESSSCSSCIHHVVFIDHLVLIRLCLFAQKSMNNLNTNKTRSMRLCHPDELPGSVCTQLDPTRMHSCGWLMIASTLCVISSSKDNQSPAQHRISALSLAMNKWICLSSNAAIDSRCCSLSESGHLGKTEEIRCGAAYNLR